MGEYKVELSRASKNDLRDIVRYISSQLSAPVTAEKMMDEIEKALSELTDMPQRCPPVTDERLNTMGYRKPIIKNYIAFFVIDESAKVVNVVRILYTRRDWLTIL